MKQIKKYKWALIIVIFLISITAIRLLWIGFLTRLDFPENPSANHGILDLRGWKFSDRKTLQLNGEWEFFPNTFITTKEQAEKRKKVYLHVPQKWDALFENDKKNSLHYGTYRLRILLDEHKQDFGFRVSELNNASAIYVNGHLIGKTGQPANTLEDHKGKNIPYSVSFTPEKKEIELLIHVSSNREKGGIIKPIRFGLMEAINFRNYLSIGLQLLLCVVLLLHSVYAVILYFIGPSPNKGLIYFSLLLICAIFSVLVSDDKLLFKWFSFDYKWSIKILFLSYIGVGAFIPLVINQLFPSYINRRALRIFISYCVLYSLFVILVPQDFILLSSKVLLSSALIFSVLIPAINLRKATTDIDEIIFLILACLSIGINIIWSTIKTNVPIELMHYPFDMIVALLCFAAFWFKRFFRVSSEVKQLADRLQLEDKRKDDFLVNTSHELRNPLYVIMNIIQSILDDNVHSISNEHRNRLKILINVSKRMSFLLNDILDVTRLKEKTIQLHMSKVHLQAVVIGVIDMTKQMVEGKPVRLQMSISNTFPPIKADENRLIQIIFNLIHNAIKFTDEGSITVRATLSNGKAQIYIEDTGIGIEPEALKKIFQPYEQASINNFRDSGGIGLGLSICKELVELHNGTITAHSVPGKGSTFILTLPLFKEEDNEGESSNLFFVNDHLDTIAAAEETHATQIFTEKNISLSKPRILAVDDDTINLNVLTTILGEKEFDITTVTSARQAMEKLEVQQFDLVISDVMMPQVSGYELTQMIRKRFSISELPVLLLTARSRTEDIVTGFQSGANDYVTKPVDSWELKARVHGLTKIKLSIEERIRMEGAWLQSQIKPHFLFNTLNSIAALGMIDVSKMQELLDEFSNYLRLSIDFQNADPLVPLEHELSLVHSYLSIEKARFGDRLKLQWELDHTTDLFIPPLSIQPLVENAVKHGILKKVKGGEVCIRIKIEAKYTEVSIIDNGIGMNEEEVRKLLIRKDYSKKRTGIGLQNVDRRLKQLYGRGLKIHSKPDEGTCITFHIPNGAN
ncbi:response regulator [Bacillus sp. Gen3]|nr:response regulator [Bacillus sp. Gen3]